MKSKLFVSCSDMGRVKMSVKMSLSLQAPSESPSSLVHRPESAILMFASFMSLSNIPVLGTHETLGIPLFCITGVHSGKRVPAARECEITCGVSKIYEVAVDHMLRLTALQ
jgi:hypothetical protein